MNRFSWLRYPCKWTASSFEYMNIGFEYMNIIWCKTVRGAGAQLMLLVGDFEGDIMLQCANVCARSESDNSTAHCQSTPQKEVSMSSAFAALAALTNPSLTGHPERTQSFAADPVYGRAKCLPTCMLGAFKT